MSSHSLHAIHPSTEANNTVTIADLYRVLKQQFVNPKQENPIMVNLTDHVYEVSDQFLSVTIDAGSIRHNWNTIDFTATRIINMAKVLAPAMLRVGGTSQDFLLFEETTKEQIINLDSNFIMNASQWDAVNVFVEAVGWDFIFGLNVLLRVNGSWNSTNAEELLTYTTSKGYKVNWELGNGMCVCVYACVCACVCSNIAVFLLYLHTELDLFAKFNISVPGSQLAKDFEKLKSLVAEKSPTAKFIAGPDVAHTGDLFVRYSYTHLGPIDSWLHVSVYDIILTLVAF